jgi:hypothetical protein
VNDLLKLTRFQFESLAEYLNCGSVYKTARHLHLTPSSVYADLESVYRVIGLNPVKKEDREVLTKMLNDLREEAKSGRKNQGT